jgi:hypothetical protein
MKRFVPFQRYILALSASLLALSLSGCGGAKIKALEAQVKTLQVHIKNDIDSPVRAVGGSIVIFADHGWTGNYPGPYQSVDTPALSKVTMRPRYRVFSGSDLLGSPLSGSWKIDVHDRVSGGVTLCSNPNCDVTADPATNGSITLQAYGNSTFYRNDVNSVDNPGVPVGKRMFDPGCHPASGTQQLGTQDTSDILERIQDVVVTLKGATCTYRCPQGDCRVLFGGS